MVRSAQAHHDFAVRSPNDKLARASGQSRSYHSFSEFKIRVTSNQACLQRQAEQCVHPKYKVVSSTEVRRKNGRPAPFPYRRHTEHRVKTSPPHSPWQAGERESLSEGLAWRVRRTRQCQQLPDVLAAAERGVAVWVLSWRHKTPKP